MLDKRGKENHMGTYHQPKEFLHPDHRVLEKLLRKSSKLVDWVFKDARHWIRRRNKND